MKDKFFGAITALATPFTESGQVDVPALKRLVRVQIEGRIDALVPCGSTGEAATMDWDEYELVVKTVVEEAKGRVPVIAGAGSNDTQKAVKYSTIAKRVGADALLHVTPFYNKPTPNGLVAHFKAVADSVGLPIILYNVPSRTGSNVSAETTLRVAREVPLVVGVKEASGNIVQMMDIVKGAPDGFAVLSGDDAFTLPLMALGGVGCISVVSNEIPGPFSDLTRAALQGNWAEARRLHYEWLDLMNANFIETNPIPLKTALAMMGLIKETVRLPLVALEPKNRETLRQVLKKHQLV